MQIGFNSEVEHGGGRYHVQTEDMGLEDGRITSQVFREGQIVDTVTVSYARATSKIPTPEARDEEIRKRMKALHAMCIRNVRGGKYDAPAVETAPPAAKAAKAEPAAAEGDEYVAGHPLPVSGDPRDTAQDGLGAAEDRDPTVVMQGLPDLPPGPRGSEDGDGSDHEPDDTDIDVVEELVVQSVTVEADVASLDGDLAAVAEDSAAGGEVLHSTPAGIVYRRDRRAFRGIDPVEDDQLLSLLAVFRPG